MAGARSVARPRARAAGDLSAQGRDSAKVYRQYWRNFIHKAEGGDDISILPLSASRSSVGQVQGRENGNGLEAVCVCVAPLYLCSCFYGRNPIDSGDRTRTTLITTCIAKCAAPIPLHAFWCKKQASPVRTAGRRQHIANGANRAV